MWKKVMLAAGTLIATTAAQAQIGYKGQMTVGAAAGINQSGSLVGSVQIHGYVSPHSVIGAGAQFDRSQYMTGDSEKFRVDQWLGNIQYQYSAPVGRFIFLPTGGFLLGMEKCDAQTAQGNMLPYGSKFVYGLLFQANVEYVLNRHWTVGLVPQLSYLINTNFDGIKLSIGAGVKYYF